MRCGAVRPQLLCHLDEYNRAHDKYGSEHPGNGQSRRIARRVEEIADCEKRRPDHNAARYPADERCTNAILLGNLGIRDTSFGADGGPSRARRLHLLNESDQCRTIGDRPDTGWLDGTPLDVTDGVLCDESLRVVGADGIVAAGAVARWPNPRYRRTPRRCGQWIAALEQGNAAAQTLLRGPWARPVTILPRFWTEQFGLRIQVCGDQPAGAEVTVTEMRPGRRDTARAGVLVSHSVEGRLVGLVAVNAPHAFTAMARVLIANTVPVKPATVIPVSPAPRAISQYAHGDRQARVA